MADIMEPTQPESEVSTPGPDAPKRRRVTRVSRACDDCRVRKVKCDGEMPCSSCVYFHQACQYNKHGRPRYSGPLYIQQLENDIVRLKFALQTAAPEVDLDQVMKIDMSNGLPTTEAAKKLLNVNRKAPGAPAKSTSKIKPTPWLGEKELLDTMIEATGRLNIDSKGGCDYLGDFAGLSFLDRISSRCSQLINPDSRHQMPLKIFPLDSAEYPVGLDNITIGQTTTDLLPLKVIARELATIAFRDACCLLNFVHRPSFDRNLDRIYETLPNNYTAEDHRFLPLLYFALALGENYSKTALPNNFDRAKGATYFRAGQSLVDVVDCHDITSLQCIICMIIYFQSSGLMHSCYSYISLAIASAFRMGLHRRSVLKFFDPVQQETRKRAFWVLQTMDTYVATMLGLPKNIRDEELDQEFPLDLDDEFITKEGFLPVPAGHMSSMAVVNAHTKLLLFMANVITYIYPNQKDLSTERPSYHVDYAGIVKVEANLEEWFRDVVQSSARETLVSPEALRVQLLLRLAYAHVQMVLYRPFIQHLVRGDLENTSDLKSYACASACVKAAMQIVWLVDEMDKRGLLIGTYWFTVYIMFFAIMSLCMFILGNLKDPTTAEVMKAALKGREILTRLAVESVSAKRCVTAIGNIFDRFSAHSENSPLMPPMIPVNEGTVDITTDSNVTFPQQLELTDFTPFVQYNGSIETNGIHNSFPSTNNRNTGPTMSFADMSVNQQHTVMTTSQPSMTQIEYPQSTMPLAAFTQALGEEANQFPVFAPAWLEQASALQTPRSESQFHF